MRRLPLLRPSGVGRPLTLLRTFLVASAVILAIGAWALSSRLSDDLRAGALEDSARDTAAFSDAVLAPALVSGISVAGQPRTLRRLVGTLRLPPDLRALNVYARNGRLVFSTTRPERVGRRRASPELEAVIRTDEPSAHLVDPGNAPKLVRAWVPLHNTRGRVVGVAEVALDDSVVTDPSADARWTIWYAVGIVFAFLWLALALLVSGASALMRSQHEDLDARSHDLVETARELEATLLETIETLNAAVEARDPYTAGHSQRVRRVSLAIGRELRLPAKQMGALGTAALFHDIGKIGMPDSILTKPERLDREEQRIMREHAARGAEIVSRITSLKDSVPAIRHHHERWDGLGYPDGLSGKDIPIEAAIIAIADAWDAMTTDRPYAAALELEEAMLQLHAGKGKQFNPVVVDAFASVARRRPAEIMPPESAPPASAIAV
ncbi:MAG TPA: HD domain-containing phosphohydrolase [Gaiellaceae bacterium]|nr:HD domain-containing phosphohydrolase [Gaiellaceae bacterium]